MSSVDTTLASHLGAEAERNGWTPGLQRLLLEMGAATAEISNEVRKGALRADLIGSAQVTNVQGEEVQKLDVFADDLLHARLEATGLVQAIGSEERDEMCFPASRPTGGGFVVYFDPLDGSSNIDVAVNIGTIFSIHHDGPLGSEAEGLRPGSRQVAAGYAIYGSSTVFVYTARNGVHSFVLDPVSDGYLQTGANIQCPANGKTYSINEGNAGQWSAEQKALVAGFRRENADSQFSGRYIGSLVADFHRTLLKGGLFMYPGDSKNPKGKLRYLYEAAPLALVAEEAGGAASDGRVRILDIQPEKLHQRTPLFLGSASMVGLAEDVLAGRAAAA